MTKVTGKVTGYIEVVIRPHHSGFGMWERINPTISPDNVWRNDSDLIQEMNNNLCLEFLDDALKYPEFIKLGIEDIRDNIYGGNPDKIFVYVAGDQIYYTGIEEVEVNENFWDE